LGQVRRFEYHKTHFIRCFIVQDQCEALERDDGVKLGGQHAKKFGNGFVASKDVCHAQ
jgi:hypothetical protein